MDLLSDVIPEPQLAPILSRMGANIIDLIILWLIAAGMCLLWGQINSAAHVILVGWPFVFYSIVAIGLIVVPEGLTGKTIGMRVVRIRVLKQDYSDGSVTSSLVRRLLDLVDYFFLLGVLVAATNKKKQRIGDLVAKTVVVKG